VTSRGLSTAVLGIVCGENLGHSSIRIQLEKNKLGKRFEGEENFSRFSEFGDIKDNKPNKQHIRSN
jgi:hypothetical protein